jgi:hypothetical protein
VPALDELRIKGAFGAQCLVLLFRLTRSEARRFPELRPSGGWTDDDVWQLAAEFFADKGEAVTRMLLAQAVDEETMGRLLRTSVRHWLVDTVRKTDRGAVRHRLENVLADSPELFERVPGTEAGAGYWRLIGAGAPSGVPFEELIEAAWRITDVVVPRWTSKTRRAPFADAASVRRVLMIVLKTAGGSLDTATLTGIFARRFPMAIDPREQAFPEDAERTVAIGAGTSDPAGHLEAHESAIEASARAREVFEKLSADERRLLPVLASGVAEQMAVLGRGRSETYRHVAALKERLRATLGAEAERDAIMLEVRDLCLALE